MKNQIMLITYANSLGSNLGELRQALDKHFQGSIGGLHILPFFPSSGDRGFAPLGYRQVDPAFGDADDIRALAAQYELMADFMVNHISRRSEYFLDFQQNGDRSRYADFFIRYKHFWPGGVPTDAQVDAIYKRKPRAPFTEISFADGTTEKLWCTFSEEQVDLNLDADITRDFVAESLRSLADMGAKLIRLDAFAYAIKRPGSSCFFIEPDIWRLLECLQGITPEVTMLPEIHEHYTIQHKLAEHGYWIYDFALPALVLHAIYSGNGSWLKHWLEISPRRQFTTLDTHDGIGMVDVKDLLPDEQVVFLQEQMFSRGANVKRIYNTEAYGNLDIYQVNSTYYSALGNDDDAYLLARAIQFFAPGIPQVYYVGALAGSNDVQLMEATRNGRDINRHYYSLAEIDDEFRRPVVQELHRLMRLRNTHPAFALDADMDIRLPEPHQLEITRRYGGAQAVLQADLAGCTYSIQCTDV